MGCFGAKIFTKLLDVPSSYVGQALKLVRVNAVPDKLEFVALADLGIPTADTIDNTKNVATASISVTDTIVETDLYTGDIGADVLKVGNVLKFHSDGVISNGGPTDVVMLKIYLGTQEILSYEPAIGKITNAHWHVEGSMTVRTIGAAGTMAYHLSININDNVSELTGLDSVDTTIAEDFKLTATWSVAKATNIITLLQGFTGWKNLT